MMFTLIRQWRHSQGLRHSALTVSSYGGASLLSALAIILLSRLLGPVAFADFSVAFALSIVLNRLNDLGLTMVIQKLVAAEFRPHKINAYLSLVLRYRLLLSVLLLLLGLLLGPWLTALLHLSNHWLIPLTFLFSIPVTFFESAQVTLQSLGRFRQAAYNYLLPAVLKLGLGLVVYFGQIHDVALITSLYLLCTVPGLLLAEWLKPRFVHYQLERPVTKEQPAVHQLLRHAAFATLATALIDNIDLLFAKHYLSAYETGLLAGQGKIALLLAVVAYALSSVLNPRVAAYTQRGPFMSYLRKAFALAGLSGLGLALIWPFQSLLVRLTIGPAYDAQLHVLGLLLTSSTLLIIATPFIACFYSFKSNRYFSYAALLQLLIVLIGNWYFVPRFGLDASAWTRMLARAGLLLLTGGLLWLEIRRKWGKG